MCRGMRWLRNIFLSIVLAFGAEIAAYAGSDVDSDNPAEIDVGDILFGHIGDSYGWHITEWNGRHISIPLPCIVRSSTGGP